MNTLDLEVFRAGDHGDRGHWDEATLDQMADDYDPSMHEAPVTADHAQSGPALGWIESLQRVGDVLVARLRDLDPGFADMIRSGAFKKRSVELYRALKETGRPYLRAVSFLGACPPAVKGLADVVFTEGDGEHESIDFAEEVVDDAQEASWVALRERLMATGRWLPSWEEEGLCEFWSSLSDERRGWFEQFLESLPEAVPTRRLNAGSLCLSAGDEGIPVSSKRAEVSSSSVSLHRRAVMFRDEHPELNYAESLRAVARGV